VRGELAGEKLVTKFGVKSTPFLLFFNPDGTELDWIAGYSGIPENFHKQVLAILAGTETVASLESLHAREPDNPEPVIKLAGKYQARQDRDKALALSKEAMSLAAKGNRTMRLENGEVVSCAEMAEYQYARTYMVTYGIIEHRYLRDFIAKFPSSYLVKDAFRDLFGLLFTGDEGIEVYSKMIERFPNDPELANRLARYFGYSGIAGEKGKILDLSLGLSENALRVAPAVSVPETAKNLANLQILKGLPEKAEETYGSGFLAGQVKSWANNLMAYAEFWLQKKRNQKDAEAAIDLALRVRPEDRSLLRQAASDYLTLLGKPEKALAIFGPEFLKTIQDSPKDLYSYFSLWIRQKKIEAGALTALERLLALKPESVYYRGSAAYALWDADQKDKARSVFGPEFVKGRPENMNSLYEYGTFWLRRDIDMEEVVPSLVKSLRTIPKGYYEHMQTAEVLRKAGKAEAALAIFGPEYLEKNQDNPDALAEYGNFWLKQKSNLESADQALEKAAGLPSLTSRNRMRLARVFLDNAKPGRAEDIYGPAYLKTLGSEIEPLLFYSQFWKYTNRNLFSALEAARKACALAPTKIEAWKALAEICVVTAEPKEGLAAVEKALGLVKDSQERQKLETLKKQIQAALDKKEG